MGLLQYFGAAPHFSPWFHGGSFGEAFANLRQRNQLATLCGIGLAALLWWAQDQDIRPGPHRAALLGSGAILLALGNAATASRTGLLQLLLIAGLTFVWGAWRRPGVLRLLFAALAAYVVGILVLPALLGQDPNAHGTWARLQAGDVACASRLTLWCNVAHLISLQPWTGWGWGELDYAHFTTLYDGIRFCEILDNAHNLPLHLAVELGIPAALLLCGGALWLVLRAQPWCEKDPSRQLAWGVLAVILLHSMLEYPLWFGPFQLALGLCVWLLWPARKMRPIMPVVLQGSTLWAGVLAASLLVGAAYAAWDYHRVSQIFYPSDFRATAYRENTLEKIRGSWLFKDQVRFAEYTLTPLTQNNAEQLHAMGLQVLHFSPEAQVVERLIESSVLLGRDEEARFYLARYKAAYPQAHARWAAKQREPAGAQ
ncbi:MAG: Wzy polymerase domain-containing protein [Hylemonella sp.]|nr:Wzy polymerase domain-containing protein [Hylemonella sp.]